MIQGLIVGHRNIGEAMLTALVSISGIATDIKCLSNDGMSTNDIVEFITDVGKAAGDDGLVIFVDVYGGSCWRAAKLAQIKNCHIITGANLPMLLSFCNKRDIVEFEDLGDVLKNDGKRGVKLD